MRPAHSGVYSSFIASIPHRPTTLYQVSRSNDRTNSLSRVNAPERVSFPSMTASISSGVSR
ncbi:MAG: hypothetical protein LBD20_07000 [Spirochaetaceae bacterium]|nr:hypothetical protein [Spirochaetaceae bacterium]